jgi:hypothetical protein
MVVFLWITRAGKNQSVLATFRSESPPSFPANVGLFACGPLSGDDIHDGTCVYSE